MCRIIVRWLDKEDVPGQMPNRKAFDPVAVLDDGVDPGSRVGFPTYMIFDLPGLPKAAAEFLTLPQYDPTGPIDPDTGEPIKISKRTGFAMAWQRTPTPIQNAITAAYEANEPYVIENVTEDDLLNWFDKKTGF
jgi:hypothetical protein